MSINRGDVWCINLCPSTGNEMRDPHPAVVINDDNIQELNLRIIIPITSWQPHFKGKSIMVKINANHRNGLKHGSAANVLQMRSVDAKRFIRPLGTLTTSQMEKIEEAIYIVLKLPFK